MKRLYTILFSMLLIFTLVGCKSQEVRNVEAKINEIGEITKESIPLIENAEKEFNLLSIDDQNKVSNKKKLESAREEYSNVLVKEVEDAISMINNDYTEIDPINNAYLLFESLTDSDKQKVKNSKDLDSAVNAYVDSVYQYLREQKMLTLKQVENLSKKWDIPNQRLENLKALVKLLRECSGEFKLRILTIKPINANVDFYFKNGRVFSKVDFVMYPGSIEDNEVIIDPNKFVGYPLYTATKGTTNKNTLINFSKDKLFINWGNLSDGGYLLHRY